MFAGCGQYPSFDHAVGDPVERDIEVCKEHRIVLIEGNYVLLGAYHMSQPGFMQYSILCHDSAKFWFLTRNIITCE